MMANNERRIDQINGKPGYSRDGTALDSGSFLEGQWTRFQKGRPKKIGGWKVISNNIPDIVRGANVGFTNGLNYIYGFAKNKMWTSVTRSQINTNVAISTTLPGLADEDIYTYQSDFIFDITGSGVSNLIIHGSNNIAAIDDTTNTPVFSVRANVNTATPTAVDDGDGGTVEVSGGVVVLQPYVFAYGNDGLIKNSSSNNPNDWKVSLSSDANEVNVAGTKIVKGLPLRAGASAPAGLFWSLDSLIKVTKAGSEFKYDTVSSQTSILSPHSTIEYDGVYYWLGTDRFLMYNGTVQEVPNTQNMNWFFDNLNYEQRTKIWAMRNTRYGEIWWFFPFGDEVECSHAIIFNIREGCWYDTRHSRSSGVSPRITRYPITFGNRTNSGGAYSIYAEEYGKDAIENGRQEAILANFETGEFGYPTGGATQEQPFGNDYWTRLIRVEPDFVLNGPLNMTVRGREFAASPVSSSTAYVITPDTERVDMREQRRHIRLKFESNSLGGDFHMGRVILHTETGDVRS